MPKIRKAAFALPSLITLFAVLCAFVSITFSFTAHGLVGDERITYLFYAAVAIVGSIAFDTFDGKIARLTRTSTKFGMELDSLADAISFGVAPAVLMYAFALHQLKFIGIFACFLYLCGALLRLARFNIELPPEGVQTHFKGIPSPGGAACIISIVMACAEINFVKFTDFELNTLAFITVAVGILMISNVRYKTMKGPKNKADVAYVITGILIFVLGSVFHGPYIGFFLLTSYFVLSGILLTALYNLKRPPRAHRRHRHAGKSASHADDNHTSDSHADDNHTSDNLADDTETATPSAEEDE
ncbi:MAG: CDP-diacylglycerol--serine O-phosphatidyltransferase [Proteobacteria bacterium]|nr:CDP-diacylglycerol--serine O-phosphatidyltransferase [Pseudomonadota bacterium]